METIIRARGLSRSFGDVAAVDGVDVDIRTGSVMGLIGPNGAGKTTLLRALLGLTRYQGDLQVLGLEPSKQRAALMEQVCFIADTATLPRWMRVEQVLDYTSGVHPRFDREVAENFLRGTEVGHRRRISDLSKGMTVQLHLALVMAIDARLLILDEPTLGLDIIYRKRFFEQLLNDYFDQERTIIVSTHQVEEVQHILTDVMFMKSGKVVLQQPMLAIEEQFTELHVVGEAVERAQAIPHVGSRTILGGKAFIYQDIDRNILSGMGEVRTPSIPDLFIAKIDGNGGAGDDQ